MKVVLLLVLLTLTNCDLHKNMMKFIAEKPPKEQFKLWHYSFSRPYDINTEMGLQRYRVFKQNVKMFEEVNSKNLGYKLGLGPFSDITYEEAKQSFLREPSAEIIAQQERKASFDFDLLADEDEKHVSESSSNNDEEKNFKSPDWSYLFQKIKNQGTTCSGGWIFSPIALIEAEISRLNQNIQISLSEQHVIDCSTIPGNPCYGGFNFWGFETIKAIGGLYKEEDYKNYIGWPDNCKEPEGKKKYVKLVSYKTCGPTGCPHPDCTQQEYEDLLTKGPYSSGVHIDSLLLHYSEGIYSSDESCLERHNHSTLVVEYERKNKVKRFKIKNSWGTQWGEKGYGHIAVKYGAPKWAYDFGCNLQDSTQHLPVLEFLN
jgi:hypothetical protein